MTFCPNCGAEAFFVEQVEHINFIDINFAVLKKEVVKNRLQKIPALGSVTESVIRKSKNLVKRIVYKSNFFEFLGFHSLGPVDGNNLEVVIDTLKAAKHLKRL